MSLATLPRIGFVCWALVCAGVLAQEEEEFQDTPLLSSLWQATSQFDNDAIDRLLDSQPVGATARASDGRGLAWWAFEFKNVYALGSIIAHGGDIESKSEDVQGQAAIDMCTQDNDCDKKAIVARAKELVADIKERKKQREQEEDIDPDEDIGDDEF
uniref:Uncharacterized protein n=1 Tax=Zooxanthella nutricula TaxID=1333877 RepID=A0A6U9KAZ1_9DINO|mmetsp:Transcript_97434/g.297715  ORF Transcript_97434/g.297715 Transcript_97434/m.297715 type:complete len:157 (+) Transcript_97434:94-564(+)